MDIALWAYNHTVPETDLAKFLDVDEVHVAYIYKDIENKRKTTHYMHASAVLVEDVPEIE
jgi:NAD+ synthase